MKDIDWIPKSAGEWKRLLQQGAVRVNGNKVDINYKITINDFNEGRCKISIGKKKHFLLEIED